MVVALTPHQWTALVGVTGTADAMAELEAAHSIDLRIDDSARYRFRHEIDAALAPWFLGRDAATVGRALTEARVLWSPYRTFAEVAASLDGPLQVIDQPGVGEVISAESPIRWPDHGAPPVPAPALGENSRDVLVRLGDMSDREVDELVRDGVVREAGA
jgi:2-methylfumaryl-CoA isomerase